ncbi:asparaginase [uncultured Roseovarius sp.]|uniref:asparaginase n=1 Tax=uncultured Roseovarius sp. TaxID=293344 RepID=UPI00262C964B|nr:asparaginase [uncultured Roseovarius sp.]
MADKRILLIHTGGTIGMVRSGDGFAPKRGVVEDEVTRLLNTKELDLSIEIAVLEPLIDSANATPRDWNRITRTITANYATFDGFVITHGTDTLAFTAAALTMALQGLEKPVILTGSMLPLSEPENDGHRNLSETLRAIGSAAPGVWVQFAGRLLHGGRIRKTHSHFFDAFAAEPADHAPQRPGGPGLIRHEYGTPDVAVLPVVPGGAGKLLLHAAQNSDGIVLRCFGSGTIPNTPNTEEALRIAEDRDIPVLAVSQCPEGGIALGTYAAGAILTRYNAVDGRDMTVEAAYVKMVLALSDGGDVATHRSFLAEPLCGELSLPEK